MANAEKSLDHSRLTPELAETAQLLFDILVSAKVSSQSGELVDRVCYRPPSGRRVMHSPPSILRGLAFLAEAGCFEQTAQEVVDGEGVIITLSEKGEDFLEKNREILAEAKRRDMLKF